MSERLLSLAFVVGLVLLAALFYVRLIAWLGNALAGALS